MLSPKNAHRASAAQKYDILTALGAYALARGKHDQRLVFRLITLITARYNWGRNELAVGQREIAALWSVDERTVKREMAKLRALGWLVVFRQGARGRVTEYRLDVEAMLDATQAAWENVGPDFDLRMRGAPEPQIVAMPGRASCAPPRQDGTEWSLTQATLHRDDPGLYSSWLAALARQGRAGGRLILRAPSRFHAAYVQTHLTSRILTACQAVDGDVAEIVIID